MAASSSQASSLPLIPTVEDLRSNTSLLSDYVDEDLEVIRDAGWRRKKSTKDGLQAFARPSPNVKKVKLFLVQGHVRCSEDDLWDLLRVHLVERQSEWHALFVDGYKLEETLEQDTTMYHMAYKGPNALVKTRDFVYAVIPHRLPEGGFLLTYRSIVHPDVPSAKGRIRGDIVRAAHMVVPDEDGCMLSSLQQADAKGWVPAWLSNAFQVSVILKEFRQMRKVLEPPQ